MFCQLVGFSFTTGKAMPPWGPAAATPACSPIATATAMPDLAKAGMHWWQTRQPSRCDGLIGFLASLSIWCCQFGNHGI
jgi:hypothetical protein